MNKVLKINVKKVPEIKCKISSNGQNKDIIQNHTVKDIPFNSGDILVMECDIIEQELNQKKSKKISKSGFKNHILNWLFSANLYTYRIVIEITEIIQDNADLLRLLLGIVACAAILAAGIWLVLDTAIKWILVSEGIFLLLIIILYLLEIKIINQNFPQKRQ